MLKLITILCATFALNFTLVNFSQAQTKVEDTVKVASDAVKPKPKAKAKKPTASKEDMNAPLTVGDDLTASQLANPLLASRMEQGCALVGGQDIQASVDASGENAGIYLLEASCGGKTKQYLYMAKPTGGEDLQEIVFAQLKTNANKVIYFQESTRRIFFSGGNTKALREIRWQELARKSMSKADMKKEENAALFKKPVPKGAIPKLP